MKNTIYFLLIAVFFVSCSSGPGPENVAKSFMENLQKGKIEEAKKFATESTGKMIDFASSLGTIPVNTDFEFKAIRDSIVDNHAWVWYKTPNGLEESVELVKVDGQWLVHVDSKK